MSEYEAICAVLEVIRKQLRYGLILSEREQEAYDLLREDYG